MTPCHTLSETSTGTPAVAVAAAESGPLRIDGAMPASETNRGEEKWREPQWPRRVVHLFRRRRPRETATHPRAIPPVREGCLRARSEPAARGTSRSRDSNAS